MKKILLSLLLAFITAIAFAQICPITVTFTSSDESTGIITFDYEFTGFEDRTHKITTVEVNFDDDEGYQQIPGEYLSGDYPDVGGSGPTFSGTIEWDGAASFPDRYQDQTKIRVKAEQHYISGDGVTDIDGNEYRTVIIGNQEWMAENLRVTRYNNEDNIPLIMDDAHWSNTTGGAYTIYDHNAWNTDGIDSPKDMVAIYGKLYNWYAATDARGFCPEGWSLPSNDDWVQLVDFVVNQGYPNEINNPNGAGNALKSCRQVNSPLDGCQTSEHPRYNQQSWHYGFDEFGFTAIPAGRRWPYGLFHLIGGYSNYWTSTEHSTVSAISHNIINSSGSVIQQNTLGKRSGFSVRCFRGLVPPEEE